MPFPKFTPKLEERREGLEAQPNTNPTPPDATPWPLLHDRVEAILARLEAMGAPYIALRVDGATKMVAPLRVWDPPGEAFHDRLRLVARLYPASQSVEVCAQKTAYDEHPQRIGVALREGEGWGWRWADEGGGAPASEARPAGDASTPTPVHEEGETSEDGGEYVEIVI